MTTKTNSIHVRMTPVEYDALQAVASLERLSISALIRQLIRSEARRRQVWPVGDNEAQGSETE